MPFFACLAQRQPDSVFRRAGLLVCMLLLGTGQRSALAALEPLSDIVAISETCALDGAGDIWCWGYNTGVHAPQFAGYLFYPAKVLGLAQPTRALASSGLTHCSIDTQDVLRCWGSNLRGQAGAGATSDLAPIGLVSGLGTLPIRDVAVSGSHACAVSQQGEVYCWGDNIAGQLGLSPDTELSLDAVVVPLPDLALAVSVGNAFSCALLDTSAVFCWGGNWFGQLGNGTGFSGHVPVLAASGYVSLASDGDHTCALQASGVLDCWGNWIFTSELEGMTFSATPNASGLVDVVAYSVSQDASCAIRATGEALCWGWNADGGLGVGDFLGRAAPTPMAGNPDFVALSGRCGLRSGGEVWCWGRNHFGQLGDGSINRIATPTQVNWNGEAPLQLALGPTHSCLGDASGGVSCWGSNRYGELGNGTYGQALLPQPSVLSEPAVGLFAGSSKTCAVVAPQAANGQPGSSTSLYCWGSNAYRELGLGAVAPDQLPLPTEVTTAGTDIHSVALGEHHACISTGELATVHCSGLNDAFQVCQEALFQIFPSFTACAGSNIGVNQLAASPVHSCGTSTQDGAVCWGDNGLGQLGTGATGIGSPLPVEPTPFAASSVEVATGDGFTCALSDVAEVWCWGSNRYGALGDGTVTDRLVAQRVPGLPPIAHVVAAGHSACARSTDGRLYCWGRNSNGQLGDGSFAHRYSPTWIEAAGVVESVAMSPDHTCALRSDSTVHCWGDNNVGQLGIGSANQRAVAGPVLREVTTTTPFNGFADGFEGL